MLSLQSPRPHDLRLVHAISWAERLISGRIAFTCSEAQLARFANSAWRADAPERSQAMPAALYAALLAFGFILLVIALMGLLAFR